MMTITFETAGVDFDSEPERECAAVLRFIAGRLERGETSGKCLSTNGNTIGAWRLSSEPD